LLAGREPSSNTRPPSAGQSPFEQRPARAGRRPADIEPSAARGAQISADGILGHFELKREQPPPHYGLALRQTAEEWEPSRRAERGFEAVIYGLLCMNKKRTCRIKCGMINESQHHANIGPVALDRECLASLCRNLPVSASGPFWRISAVFAAHRERVANGVDLNPFRESLRRMTGCRFSGEN